MNASRRFGADFFSTVALIPTLVLVSISSAGADDVELNEVVVSTTGVPTGTAAEGYRDHEVDMGPLGDRDPLNTPHAVDVIPGALIRNSGGHNLADVIKFVPSAQIEARGGIDVGRPQTRGFQGDIVQNTRMDGMSVFAVVPYPMDQLAGVEILSGLSGGLFGPAAPAGTFNFILKRPTEDPLREIGLEYDSNGILIERADIGGRQGWLGYRVNFLHGDGEGWVDGSKRQRKLVSGNFDFHLSDDTVLETNASHYIDNIMGFPGGFSYSPTTQLPSALDATKVGYGQAYAGQQVQVDIVSARLKHDFDNNWKLTAGLLAQSATRNLAGISNAITTDGKFITQSMSTNMTGTTYINSGLARLEGAVDVLGTRNDLVLGVDGYRQSQFPNLYARKYNLGTFPIDDPTVFPEPGWLSTGPQYKSGENRTLSLIFGDTLTLNDYWSVFAHAAYSWLEGESYNTAGIETSSYAAEGLSPTLSLMFKPTTDSTAYFTYSDSLQKGDTAPTSGVANPGQTLAPYRSTQWEAGWKVEIGKMDYRVAGFRIERPFAYVGTDNVFREQGEQVNYGFEFVTRGKLTDDLTIVGGITLLDPKLTETRLAATENKLVVGVPQVQANVYAEYALPFSPDLYLTANVHYTGRRAANDTNTTWADAYTTVDLGLRKGFVIEGVKATARLWVYNITDESYWVSVFPSSINGENAGNPTAFLGAPRTVWASLTTSF